LHLLESIYSSQEAVLDLSKKNSDVWETWDHVGRVPFLGKHFFCDTYFIKRLLGQIFDFTTFLICHQIEEKRMKRKVKDVFVVNSKVKTNPSLFNKGMSFLFVLIK
jgi:hypothetical protein